MLPGQVVVVVSSVACSWRVSAAAVSVSGLRVRVTLCLRTAATDHVADTRRRRRRLAMSVYLMAELTRHLSTLLVTWLTGAGGRRRAVKKVD